MKKFLLVAALVGMVAAPASAGLVPIDNLPAGVNYVTNDLRSAAYAPNDPNHVYDHMASQLGLNGPEPIAFVFQQNATSRAIWHYIKLRPGATAISSLHLLVDQRILPSAVVTFGLYPANLNAPNISSVIGSPLLTTGGSTAVFQLPNATTGFINLATALFPPVPVSGLDIWIGFQSNNDFRLLLDTGAGDPDPHGVPGDAANGANHIGSAFGTFATCYSPAGACGVGLFQQSQITTMFNFTNANSVMMTLGGTPEPASLALLAGGLFALRRRKARA